MKCARLFAAWRISRGCQAPKSRTRSPYHPIAGCSTWEAARPPPRSSLPAAIPRCIAWCSTWRLPSAREEIEKAGLCSRIETRVGDYFRDEFGEGFDLVYISNIIHSMGPEDIPMLFGKSHRALVPGGTIIVKDFFLEDDRISPNVAALFSVNMLVGTEAGRSYTLRETQEMLSRAGFSGFRTVEVAAASQLLIARKA
jgi:hypothetical protein